MYDTTHQRTQHEEDLFAELRWGGNQSCPFCGCGENYALNLKTVNRTRYKCRKCRRQFSVTKGTILEGSKLSFGEWIHLLQILCNAPRPLSIGDLHRELNISYGAVKNALDRLAYAAKRAPLAGLVDEEKTS